MARADILDLGSWCILRMASADTLKVAESLADAGLDVWTPVERRIGRMPKTRARYDKESALMPSYVFGRVEHIAELLHLAMNPNRQHPRFSVFHYQGGVPLVADSALGPLRSEEERKRGVFDRFKRRVTKGPVIERGAEVRMSDGPFAGLGGIVEDQQGQYTLVNFAIFGKPVTIKVASLLLLDDMRQGSAAKAA